MVKYPSDASIRTFPKNDKQSTIGGNLSVRQPPDFKIVKFVGQDEVIFNQYLFFGTFQDVDWSQWGGSAHLYQMTREQE